MIATHRNRIILGTFVAATVALAALTGCAPAVPTGAAATNAPSAGSSAPAGSASGSTQTASCDEFTPSAFSGLTSEPIGKPFVAASETYAVACWFGTGKNVGVTGSSVEMLPDDNVLITVIAIDAPNQYTQDTAAALNIGSIVPISGVGDKASYNVSALTDNVPQLYALKGSVYCHVQVNIDVSKLASSDPATIAKAEGALCEDAFNH
jgi:hypothetical protein